MNFTNQLCKLTKAELTVVGNSRAMSAKEAVTVNKHQFNVTFEISRNALSLIIKLIESLTQCSLSNPFNKSKHNRKSKENGPITHVS